VNVQVLYEEDPGDAPVPSRVELEVPLDASCIYLVSVEAMQEGVLLNARQEAEAVERATHHYAREAGLSREWVASVRVTAAPVTD
jgi:hypothetical protein